MTYAQMKAARLERHDACWKQAREMLECPLGWEADREGYYTQMFGWLFDELMRGRIPNGVPQRLLDGWRGKGRGGNGAEPTG